MASLWHWPPACGTRPSSLPPKAAAHCKHRPQTALGPLAAVTVGALAGRLSLQSLNGLCAPARSQPRPGRRTEEMRLKPWSSSQIVENRPPQESSLQQSPLCLTPSQPPATLVCKSLGKEEKEKIPTENKSAVSSRRQLAGPDQHKGPAFPLPLRHLILRVQAWERAPHRGSQPAGRGKPTP